MVTDKLLINFQKGDKAAFDELYKLYSKGMFGICLRYTRCEDDAQEVLQESFIKVYVHRAKYNIDQSIGAWIKRITINSALTFIKQNYRYKLVENELEFDQMEIKINEEEDLKSLQEKLLVILNKLPDGYRTVFNLFTIDNLTHKEIAAYLDISENTSKTQLFKAKKMIQQIIENEKVLHEKN